MKSVTCVLVYALLLPVCGAAGVPTVGAGALPCTAHIQQITTQPTATLHIPASILK
jgi:hypothetical protein